jgi:glycosyltransferase involved in cell wall biosynthesis
MLLNWILKPQIKMRLVIQIPCYNEEKNIAETLNAIPSQIDGIDEIIKLIIDDGSNDKTSEIAKQNGALVVSLRYNMGLAKAFQVGLKESLKLGADIVVNTDGDNQYKADDIKNLTEPIVKGDADFVVGCRPIRNHPEFSKPKIFLQLLGSWVLRKVSKTNIPDAASGFRAYSRETCLKLNIYSSFSHCMETLIQAGTSGLKVKWVNIRINPKTRKSRLFNSIPQYIFKSAQTVIHMSSIYSPGRFFGGLGILSLLPAILLASRFLILEATGLRDPGTHLPSLIIFSVFTITGLLLISLAILGELIKSYRKLNEEILYQFKKQDFVDKE